MALIQLIFLICQALSNMILWWIISILLSYKGSVKRARLRNENCASMHGLLNDRTQIRASGPATVDEKAVHWSLLKI